MRNLQAVVDHLVAGYVPGAVALVDRDGEVEVAAAGLARADGMPASVDTIFRAASITKPVLAAMTMVLAEDGTLALEAPVRQWLPELAHPAVLRTPASSLDDVVPAERDITVEHLLTFTGGLGFPSDFDLPVVAVLFEELLQGPPQPQAVPAPDEWMRRVEGVPLLHQPGDGWTYNLGADLLGVLIARATDTDLATLLRAKLFGPLGMVDTGFSVPEPNRSRLGDYWASTDNGRQVVDSATTSQWFDEPAFPSGAGGLVTTIGDWWRFGRMLVHGGSLDGVRLLSPESVREMTTDRLTDDQKRWGRMFLEGQGWGYGGSVDGDGPDVWNVAGRYGWVGGTGTSAHVIPSQRRVALLFTQLQVGGPDTSPLLHDFWRYAASG